MNLPPIQVIVPRLDVASSDPLLLELPEGHLRSVFQPLSPFASVDAWLGTLRFSLDFILNDVHVDGDCRGGWGKTYQSRYLTNTYPNGIPADATRQPDSPSGTAMIIEGLRELSALPGLPYPPLTSLLDSFFRAARNYFESRRNPTTGAVGPRVKLAANDLAVAYNLRHSAMSLRAWRSLPSSYQQLGSAAQHVLDTVDAYTLKEERNQTVAAALSGLLWIQATPHLQQTLDGANRLDYLIRKSESALIETWHPEHSGWCDEQNLDATLIWYTLFVLKELSGFRSNLSARLIDQMDASVAMLLSLVQQGGYSELGIPYITGRFPDIGASCMLLDILAADQTPRFWNHPYPELLRFILNTCGQPSGIKEIATRDTFPWTIASLYRVMNVMLRNNNPPEAPSSSAPTNPLLSITEGINYTSKVKPRTMTPRRFDFALIVITPGEYQAVQGYFQFEHDRVDQKFRYDWGRIEGDARTATVCLINLGDVQGDVNAGLTAMHLMETLRPERILVLGIAAAVTTPTKPVPLGTVAISYLLHCGTVRSSGESNPLRAVRALQPSEGLYGACSDLAMKNRWQSLLPESIPETQRSEIIARADFEFVSLPSLRDGEDVTTRKLVSAYPRAGVFEMEAAGVAEYLWHYMNQHHTFSEYIVIKGISDLLDLQRGRKSKESTADGMREQRHKSTFTAATASAAFAKALILDYCKRPEDARRSATPWQRLVPHGVKPVVNEHCCGILHSVTPADYSKIAGYNFDAEVEDRGDHGDLLFTVCGYEPYQLWKILKESFQKHNRQNPDVQSLVGWARREFPHFERFAALPTVCTRVLLLRDISYPARNREQHWELFRELNGNIPCWIAFRSQLPRDATFLTDHVIIGGSLILDYYADSCTLILTEPTSPGEVYDELLKVKDLLDAERRSGKRTYFTNLADVNTRYRSANGRKNQDPPEAE